MPKISFFFKPVINAILNQWLERELGKLTAQQLIGDFNSKIEQIRIADSLNFQVVFHVLNLFPQRDDIFAVAQCNAVKVSQRLSGPARFITLTRPA
ncbi:hypothetical protein D3C75_892790 [compost metagenome]